MGELMTNQPNDDTPAPKKRGPKKGTVKRPDVSKRNLEKPVPRFAPNPGNERTELVSGRVSVDVADYLISPKERLRISATGGKMKWGERIDAAILRLIDLESRL